MTRASGEVDSETGDARRGRAGEEGTGEGEDLETALESSDGARSGGLAESNVGDGAGAAEDANAALAAAGEVGDGVGDVGAAGDLHDVAAESVGAVTGDDDGGFGFVLGAGRAATRAARADIDGAFVGFAGVAFFFIEDVIVGDGVFGGGHEVMIEFLGGRAAGG